MIAGPAEMVLPRLQRVRSTGDGRWASLCPAHDDRGPSLSIRQLADGTLLLKCFRGDSVAAILDALGLTFPDLFSRDIRNSPPSRRPNATDLKSAVRAELDRVIADESACLGYEVPQLSRHLALARRRIAQRNCLRLTPPAVRWEESEPTALDPLWRTMVGQAIRERAARCDVAPEYVNARAQASVRVADAIIADARQRLRVLAKGWTA